MMTGLGVGWVLALALKGPMAAVVEMHVSHDFALLTCLTIGLAVVGLLVSLIPARRASSIEPVIALRLE